MSNAEKDMRQERERDRPNTLTAEFVCSDCGLIWGRREPPNYVVTMCDGECDVCGARAELIHVRHYGWLVSDRQF